MTRMIARSGMKGRKKDTFVLYLILTLSFLFIVTAIAVQTSIAETKTKQRYTLYGDWQAAYYYGTENIQQLLSSHPSINSLGISYILGESSCGLVGTFNDELEALANFKLYEGRLPESENEIALELNQLSSLKKDVKIGDTITLSITTPFLSSSEERYNEWYLANEDKIAEQNQGYIPVRYTYNQQDFDVVEDTSISVNTVYFYFYSSGTHEETSAEYAVKNGYMDNQNVTFQKKFVVTGILQSYSSNWLRNDFSLPNCLITEEGGKRLLEHLKNSSLSVLPYDPLRNFFVSFKKSESSAFDSLSSEFPPEVLTYSSLDENLAYTYVTIERQHWLKNTLSYPNSSGSLESFLTFSIIGIVFIATACSIFQIFLTQLKRRARRIVLLKSLGATNGQIGRMLLWEGGYLLLFSLPVGLFSGLFLSFFVILLLNQNGMEVSFYLNPPFLLFGLFAGCIALLLGMLMPLYYAIRIPLTGTMEKPIKHKKKEMKLQVEKLLKNPKYQNQNFSSISKRHNRVNRSKTILSFSLSTLTISLLLFTLFLAFLFFGDYRDTVLLANRPDYIIESDYGIPKKRLEAQLKDLQNISGIQTVQTYNRGDSLYLWYENMKNCFSIQTFLEKLPEPIKSEHFESIEDSTICLESAYKTILYGIDPDSELCRQFQHAITIGNLDEKNFKQGKEVIVLIPLSHQGKQNNSEVFPAVLEEISPSMRFHRLLRDYGILYTGYDKAMKYYYDYDTCLQPGDTISLASSKEILSENPLPPSYYSTTVKVGAIIYYFPERGIWPFLDTIESHAIIGSYQLIDTVYPNSKYGIGTIDPIMMPYLLKLSPTKYGHTVFYLYTKNGVENTETNARLLTYSNDNLFHLTNYKESNDALLYKALTMILIIGLLGITSTIIACVILMNVHFSNIEQERPRIGILQSMGVTKKQFTIQYLKSGLLHAINALLLSHIFLFFALLFTSMGRNYGIPMSFIDYFYDILYHQLVLYPWWLHLLFCIFFIVITLLTHYLPYRKIMKYSPIENINSSGR